MAFFNARPHFENRQMVQWMGESIHLSGQTNFDLGGFNSYIYDSYEDFLNGVSGATFLSLPTSASTNPISGWSNQGTFSPGIIRIVPARKTFFSGNTSVVTATTQEDVTNYIATSFDSQGTIVWKPFSGITSASGACTPDFYVGTIHPCTSGGTIIIEGNLLVRGDTISATTIIETETILVEDNNIEMNYGGSHTTAIGGGITILSGISNSQDSTIATDSNGTFIFDPGLSSPTLSACTALYSSNIYACSGSAFLDLDASAVGNVRLATSNTVGLLNPGDGDTNLWMVTGGYSLLSNKDGSNTMHLEMDYLSYGANGSTPTVTLYSEASNIFTSNGEMKIGMDNYESSEIGGLFFGANYFEHKSSGDLNNLATILSSRNSTIESGVTYNNVIVGGRTHLIEEGVNDSVILGGTSIIATASNTAYVPTLNISSALGGTPVSSLSITSDGTVITGSTVSNSIGEICSLCNYTFTGDTGTTITITDGISDVLTEEPLDGTVTVDCVKCCTEWAYKYVDNSTEPRTIVSTTTTSFGDIKTALGNSAYSSLKYKCISSNSTGTKETGVEHGTDVRNETIPEITTEPTPIGGLTYTGLETTNTEQIEIGSSVYNVKVVDSARVKVEYATLVGISGSSYSTVDTSINTMTYNSHGTKIESSHDSIISNSYWSVMGSSKESTLNGNYTTILSSNNVETQSTEGTSIIAGKDITATQDYTLYTSGLFVDDVNGLNTKSVQVSTPTESCNFVITSGGSVGIKVCEPTFDLEVGGSFGATSKSFVIPHPTKEGKKLVYGAIEGPEFGVYTRGKISNIIELPEYWTELVDEDTITVQLTGDGIMKSPYVKEIKDNKVFVGNRFPFISPTGFYTVYGERKDIDKIITEIDD